ncbi:protein NRT1/ PTR FAMILY 8.5-like [Rhododendron vialii]|uniref:protein NRT1/ PTR FAMILY 8.5-like n=1 Tax=Rhododendron vialii TaxID=182163 RepID=UPI00265EB03A|nr:protein NRT1/ PTR FAMILY 8.5-like [Rhododendron vialii]
MRGDFVILSLHKFRRIVCSICIDLLILVCIFLVFSKLGHRQGQEGSTRSGCGPVRPKVPEKGQGFGQLLQLPSVSANKGWWWGFLICTVVTGIGYAVLAVGRPFYRIHLPGESPVIRIAQLIVVPLKNQRMNLPESLDELYEIKEKESISQEEILSHTKQFR